MSEIPRARQHLIAAGKRFPGAWRTFDDFRAERGKGLPLWPDWCFAPIAGAYAIVSGRNQRVPRDQIPEVARLAGLAAWRPAQWVFRFDDTLFKALVASEVNGELPCELLYRLPTWCVYIETPGLHWLNKPLYGFFAYLEWDANTRAEELRLLIDGEDELQPMPIHLGPWTLGEAVARAVGVAKVNGAALGLQLPEEGPALLARALVPMVSLLLYLCTENAEIGDGRTRPTPPAPKRTKQGWRLFPAERSTTWDVGLRLGAALRKATLAEQEAAAGTPEGGERARPRAHVRRSHWHTFLAGEGRSERRVKWLPPIAVNVDDTDLLPATVRPVQPRT